jgi:hypothetical protein
MAPQNFNPWSLTFDHVLFDDSQVAITTNNYDCTVNVKSVSPPNYRFTNIYDFSYFRASENPLPDIFKT